MPEQSTAERPDTRDWRAAARTVLLRWLANRRRDGGNARNVRVMVCAHSRLLVTVETK